MRRVALIECFEKALALVRSVVLLLLCATLWTSSQFLQAHCPWPRWLSAARTRHCALRRLTFNTTLDVAICLVPLDLGSALALTRKLEQHRPLAARRALR